MNVFPIPEDPPVITTAEKDFRASLSEDMVTAEDTFSVSNPNLWTEI
jgi:hypothetical protein